MVLRQHSEKLFDMLRSFIEILSTEIWIMVS